MSDIEALSTTPGVVPTTLVQAGHLRLFITLTSEDPYSLPRILSEMWRRGTKLTGLVTEERPDRTTSLYIALKGPEKWHKDFFSGIFDRMVEVTHAEALHPATGDWINLLHQDEETTA